MPEPGGERHALLIRDEGFDGLDCLRVGIEHLSGNLVDIGTGHSLNRQIHLGGFSPHFRVLQHVVEGLAQDRKPFGGDLRHAISIADRDWTQQQTPHLFLLLGRGDIEDGRYVRQLRMKPATAS